MTQYTPKTAPTTLEEWQRRQAELTLRHTAVTAMSVEELDDLMQVVTPTEVVSDLLRILREGSVVELPTRPHSTVQPDVFVGSEFWCG
jgi:hypothetical protein